MRKLLCEVKKNQYAKVSSFWKFKFSSNLIHNRIDIIFMLKCYQEYLNWANIKLTLKEKYRDFVQTLCKLYNKVYVEKNKSEGGEMQFTAPMIW